MTEEPTRPITYPSLDSRIRVFRHGDIVDTFAVLTERFLVLIDTATRPEAMEAVLAALEPHRGNRALLVVNTHGDWDHVWGNAVFDAPRAPILAHRLAPMRMVGPQAEAHLASLRAEHPGIYGRVRLTPPTMTAERCEIDGGDLVLHLIPTPGHTPDHLAIWIPQIRCLLAGDAAEIPFPLVSEDGSLSQLQRSLHLMHDLEPRTVLYCHAPGRTDGGVIAANLTYFDELEARCREAGPGAGPDDLNWPLEEALPAGMTLDAVSDLDFYRRFHAANITAALKERAEETT